MGSLKKHRPKSLAHGRPPVFRRPKSISRKATKMLINAHHVLEKRKRQAILEGNKVEEATTTSQLSALGGIEAYQHASLQGQSNDRGGDSSKVLMGWLKSISASLEENPARTLEVGALSS